MSHDGNVIVSAEPCYCFRLVHCILMIKERSSLPADVRWGSTDSYWNKAIQFHCFSEQRQTHATFDWFIELIRQSEQILAMKQRAKKVVFDSPGLVNFVIGLVNSVFNLPDGQVMFFWGIRITEELWNQFCSSKSFLGLAEMTFGLVTASLSLPEGQAVKMIFFARCEVWLHSLFNILISHWQR